jgi:hypothetical protein
MIVPMKEAEKHPLAAVNRPRLTRYRFLYVLLAICALVVVAMMFIPVLVGPHSRRYTNEWGAARSLRTVTALQNKYAVAHPEKGFACELSLLKPSEQQEFAVYEPLILVTGMQAGYRFSLGGCYAEKGKVVHYQVTAVPIQRGTTGLAAFCGDDSGSLWYDPEGSATNCLTSRRPLQ